MLTHNPDMNVLIADDDEVSQFIAKKLMDYRGWNPIIVNNGEEAISAFSKEKFDLILMDIHMPILDGVKATSRIRSMEGTIERKLPIVAITNGSLRPVEAKAYGFTALLRKPLNDDYLTFLQKLITQN